LAAINAGDAEPEDFRTASDTRKIKIYDFKRPDVFSKTQMRTLSLINEDFARRLATLLGYYFNTKVHIHVASIDQLTYEEFARSIPTPTSIALINMNPLGRIAFEIDPDITSFMLNRLFDGEQVEIKHMTDLTGLEKISMGWVIEKALICLKEVWKDIVDSNPKLDNLETDPQFIQLGPPGAMVILATLETKICDVEGMMNLCLPYSTLQPVIDRINAYFSPGIKPTGHPLDPSVCGRIVMDSRAILFKKEIPYKEILTWKKGTVLYPSVAQDLRYCTLYSNGVELFSASLIEDKPFYYKRIKLEHIGNFKEDTMNNKDLKFQKDPSTMQEALNRMTINCSAELGRLKATQEEMLSWREGTILTLDKLAGEAIDIYANNVLVAKGEVVVIDENFGVRITDLPVKEEEAYDWPLPDNAQKK
jgi:flagellar motor switch protein FliM